MQKNKKRQNLFFRCVSEHLYNDQDQCYKTKQQVVENITILPKHKQYYLQLKI